MSLIRRHRWLQASILLGPAAIWGALFIIFPVFEAAKMSTSQMKNYHLVSKWTFENFHLIFSNPLYTEAIARSVIRGLIVAVLAVGLSLPLAHFISFRVKRHQFVWFGAVVVALWLGYLLCIVGFRLLLGRDGVINGILTGIGILKHPSSALIFNPISVIIVQTHLAMSFSFIPIFVVMQRVPHRLMHAAADLGAGPWRQIVEVELPLISTGVAIGAVFAFVLSFGDYLAPTLVGDPGSLGIANLAAGEFEHGLDWPLGAAIGIVMIAVVLLALSLPAVPIGLARLAARLRARRAASAIGATHALSGDVTPA
jgi:spermidine/putrescine transport system permease protein